jgi:hypothetical protein
MFAPDTGATGWSMRTCLCVAVVMMMSIVMFAQMPVGGTFNNVQAQQVQYGTPITSPPIVSLGNGLTPTVITNRQPYVVGAPQFVQAENAPTTGVQENPQEQQTAAAGTQQTARKRFDFVVTSGGTQSGEATGDTRSLVEVAATTRKTRVAPAEGKAYTNDDVGRMNQKYGMRPQAATPTDTDRQVAPTQNQPVPGNANPPKK